MPKQNYLPYRKDELDTWEEVYYDAVEPIALTLGLDAAEILAHKTIISDHRTSFSTMEAKKAESKAAVEANDAKEKLARDAIRSAVKRMKAHPNYTTELGDTLGIEGTETTLDPQNMKPTLTVSLQVNQPLIGFKKEGLSGISLYRRRGAETEFTFLGKDTYPPYLDSEPKLIDGQPEAREYKAFFLDGDDEVGLESDIVKIVVP
ncbi:hypothetical protein ACFLSV_02180 [Bacteroidota bacterium]